MTTRWATSGIRPARVVTPRARRGRGPRVEPLESRCLLSAGDLDPAFGSSGYRTIDLGLFDNAASGLAVQSDGKIVVVGRTHPSGSSSSDFLVARLNADGSRDATFGTNGLVATDFGGGEDAASAVAIQSDGKIVVAGAGWILGDQDFAFARYNPDGSLDTSFGTSGRRTVAFGTGLDQAFDLAIQPGGAIVAAGVATISGSGDFALVRLTSTGALDPTFDGDGRLTTNMSTGSGHDVAGAVALLPDGRIVAAGVALVGNDYDFAAARFLSSGQLDATFGTGGRTTIDFALGNDVANSLAILDDGRMVLAGTSSATGSGDFAAARLNANGTIDTTFGVNGRRTIDFAGAADVAYGLAVQPDGRIVLAGTARIGPDSDLALARLDTSGNLDGRFGTEGRKAIDLGFGDDALRAVTLDPSGKIVAAGTGLILGDTDLVVARFLNDVSVLDRLEPNDSLAAARDLGTITGTAVFPALSVHAAGNDDWYRFTISASGTPSNAVSIDFSHALGDLDLELYDSAGQRRGRSAGVDDSEAISLGGLPAGTYVVHVSGYSGATNPDYALTIAAPLPLRTDPFEPNNTIDQAHDLGTLAGQRQWEGLSIDSASDLDWIRFTTSEAGTSAHFVRIDFDAALGDIDMLLFDDEGNVAGQSTGVTGREQIALEGRPQGSYWLVVLGYQQATNPRYTLTISAPGTSGAPPWDQTEPNDDPRTATPLGTIQGVNTWGDDPERPLSIHSSSDVDWYSFRLDQPGGPGDFVAISFDHSRGDVDLELLDASGASLAVSQGTTSSERISLEGRPAGNYLVRVYGFLGAVNPAYSLTVHGPGGTRFEPNETAGDATRLPSGGARQEANLAIGPAGDVDWYRIELAATATVAHYARITFSNVLGDVDMELYDGPSAPTPVRWSRGVGDTETIPFTGLGPGTYYLRVYGYNNATNPDYTLTWCTPEIASAASDPNEPNNDRNHATDLGTLTAARVWDDRDHPLSISENDEDWFQFTTAAAGTPGAGAAIAFRQSEGDLDLELYDSRTSATPVRVSRGIGDSESVSLAGLPAGVYYLRVVGYRASTTAPRQTNPRYALLVNPPLAAAPDPFEPNNAIAAGSPTRLDLSTSAGLFVQGGLSLHSPADRDFFEFQLGPGASEGHLVAIAFQNTRGDLDLRLYDASRQVIATAAGVGDVERISLAGRPPGTYFLEVYGQANPRYALLLSTPEGAGGDRFEPNNTIDQPADLRTISGPQLVAPMSLGAQDEDWFTFRTLDAGSAGQGVAIVFDQAQGDLDLELYDQDRRRIGQSDTASNVEWVSLEGRPAGVYSVRVLGHAVPGTSRRQSNARYALIVSPPPQGAPADWAERHGTFTDNNAQARAHDLQTIEGTRWWAGLSIHEAGDADWFQFRMETPGAEQDAVSIHFDPGADNTRDLTLRLYDASGRLIGQSATTGFQESISLAGRPAGPYFIEIVGATPSATNAGYALRIEATRPVRQDWAEPHAGQPDNNARQRAYDLRTIDQYVIVGALSIDPSGDEDWFRFETTSAPVPGQVVRVDYDASGAPLALELYREGSATPLAIPPITVGPSVQLNLDGQGLTPGVYSVRVRAAQGGGTNPSYALTVVAAPQLTPDALERNDTAQTAHDLRTPAAEAPRGSIRSTRGGGSNNGGGIGSDVLNLISHLELIGLAPQGSYSSLLAQSGSGDFLPLGGNPGQFYGPGIPTGYVVGGTASGPQQLLQQVMPSTAFAGLGTGSGANPLQTITGNFASLVQGLSGGNVYNSAQLNDALNVGNTIFDAVQGSGAYSPFFPQQNTGMGLSPAEQTIFSGLDSLGLGFGNTAPAYTQPTPIYTPPPAYVAPPPNPIGGLTLSQFNALGSTNPLWGGTQFGFPSYGSGSYGYPGTYNPVYSFPQTNYFGMQTSPNGSPFFWTIRGAVPTDTLTVVPNLSIDSPADEDWFRFTLEQDGQGGESARITFDAAKGALGLELYDQTATSPSPRPIRTAQAQGNGLEIGLAGLPAGVYYLRVLGAPADGGRQTNPSYTLALSTAPGAAPVADFTEPFSSQAQPHDLGRVEGARVVAGLSIHAPADEDWFQIQTAATGANGDLVRIDYRFDQGDLDLALYDATGQQLVALAPGANPSESTRDFEEISLTGLPAGTYRVKVYGYRGATSPSYALTVRGPSAAVAPDALEPNNDPGRPTDLTRIAGVDHVRDLTIHTGDVDLFKIRTLAPGTSGYSISLDAAGNARLRLELLDPSGQTVHAVSTADSAHQSLLLRDADTNQFLPAGDYLVRVSGMTPAQAGRYELHVNLPTPSTAPPGQQDRGAWTIMVYMTASTLEPFAFQDVNEMEFAAASLPASARFAVFWDQTAGMVRTPLGPRPAVSYPTGAGSQPAWNTAGQAVIVPDGNMDQVATRFEIRPQEVDSSAPATLVDFVTWAAQAAPADRYALVIWDHGGGLNGTNQDDDSGGGMLTPAELASALTTLRTSAGIGFDVIAFDACLMATVEVASLLGPHTGLVAASEESEGGEGYDYRTAFSTLFGNPPAVTPEALAAGIVNSYAAQYVNPAQVIHEDTHSAVRTSRLEAVQQSLLAFVNACLGQAANAAVWNALRSALSSSPQFDFPEYRDLGRYLRAVAASVSDTAIRAAAQTAADALAAAVLARTADHRDSLGLSIFLPAPGSPEALLLSWYRANFTAFNTATGWDRFLDRFLAVPGGTGARGTDWAGFNRTAALSFNLQALAGRGLSYDRLTLAPAEPGASSDPNRQTGEAWFRFTTTAPGTAGDAVAITYDPGAGSLRLRLASRATDGSFRFLGAPSASGSGRESVGLAGQPAGEYFIVVDFASPPPGSAAVPYALAIDAPGSVPAADWAAGNDRAVKARELGVVAAPRLLSGLTANPGESDWFSFETPRAEDPVNRVVRIVSSGGPLTARLFATRADALAGRALVVRSGTGAIELPYSSGDGQAYWLEVRPDAAARSAFRIDVGDRLDEVLSLAPLANQTIDEGQTLVLTAALASPTSHPVAFSLGAGAPPGAAIDAATGVLTWTAADGPGAFPVTVRATATDAPELTDSRGFTVTVRNVAPTVFVGGDLDAVAGQSWSRAGSFADPGRDIWTATVDYGDGLGPRPLALNADKTFLLDHAYPNPGTSVVTVTVADDDGGVHSARFTVRVSPPPDTTPPIVTLFRTIVRNRKLSTILVGFSEPMHPDGVRSLASYRLVSAGRDRRFGTRDDRALKLVRVDYDPTTQTATLTAGKRVPLGQPLQLVVDGKGAIIDLALNALDGDRDGRPGGDFLGRFGRKPRA